eukprot:scpid88715/ scgid29432/ 
MEIQTTRLWTVLALVVTECCLVSVLVSMAAVTPINSNSTGNVTPSYNVDSDSKVCWNWGADSNGLDCPVDLLFSQVLFTALGIVAALIPAVLQCVRHCNGYHNTCLCPSAFCEVISFFSPLFFSLISALLCLIYVAIVIDDNRFDDITLGLIDLSYEMIHRKPWRIALTSLACLQVIFACIFAGHLAAKWRAQRSEGTGHLQSRPFRSRGMGRSNLKASLFVTDL